MKVVTWILKMYCNLVETKEAEDNWESFSTYQNFVLNKIKEG